MSTMQKNLVLRILIVLSFGTGFYLLYSVGAFLMTLHSARTPHGLFKTRHAPSELPAHLETATFAAGCFWGVEEEFRKQKGVIATSVGFMGGHTKHPTYKQVCYEDTGHAEVVQVEFDPTQITYRQLLELFWDLHDPTTLNRQGPDVGDQYRSAIFYHSESQRADALATRDALEKSGELADKIVTEITAASEYTPAEDYHQQYVEKGGRASCHFRRKQVPLATPSTPVSSLKKDLTPLQKMVTQHGGTEPAFQNEYWNEKRPGIYVDVVTGEALFSSLDKYDSGTGWPSFTQPIPGGKLKTQTDHQIPGMPRTEVKSQGNSHLGHVFDDGPGAAGTRYCINSAAMRFIPLEKLEAEGYGQFKYLFLALHQK